VPFLTTCGYTKYVEYDVSNALISGCYYKNKTKTVNKSEFPRPFENTYNFNFGDVLGPYWEFPLISSAGYIGGKSRYADLKNNGLLTGVLQEMLALIE
jgi:hypothetical protein